MLEGVGRLPDTVLIVGAELSWSADPSFIGKTAKVHELTMCSSQFIATISFDSWCDWIKNAHGIANCFLSGFKACSLDRISHQIL